MGIGPFEILIVLAVLALIIGPRRVTNMARSLGRGVQDFVSELSDGRKQSAIGKNTDEEAEDEDHKPSKTPDKS